MSGVKFTQVELDKYRQALQEAEIQLNQLNASIDSVKQHISNILGDIPSGVVESFPQEVNAAKNWLGIQLNIIKNISTNPEALPNQVTSLQSQINNFKNHLEQGQRQLEQVNEIKQHRRDERAKQLSNQLVLLQSEVAGLSELAKHWQPERFLAIEKALADLPAKIDNGEFPSVQQNLQQQTQNLNALTKDVTELQRQDEQRRFVLESLQAVCKEMGWDEEQQPILSDTVNPASPILYSVQTWSAGIMNFSLSLEGIQVESHISKEGKVCHTQFNVVSEKLKNFGVTTEFRTVVVDDEEPDLRAKGELDLPDDGEQMYREQG